LRDKLFQFGPLLTLILAAGHASTATAQFGGPAQVEVVPVERREIAPTTRLVGTINPQRRTVLAAEVAGAVIELTVDIGDQVRKGDVLCRLRDSMQRFDLSAAEARRDEWRAELALEQANLDKARFEKERIARLAALQRSDKEVNDSEADLRAAEQRVARAKARIAAADADINRVRDQLERMQTKAPFDGVVVQRLTELGQWVETGGQIFEVIDLATVRARVNVHESAISHCAVGQEIFVSITGLNTSVNGTLARIVPDADLRARTFPVEIDIANPDGRLRSGMFVHAALPSGPRAQYLVVPKDAVMLGPTGKTIWIARPGDGGHMAAPTPIEIIAEADDRYAIQSRAVSIGDLVIVRGNESLRGPGPVIVRKGGADGLVEKAPPAQPNEVPKKASTRRQAEDHSS